MEREVEAKIRFEPARNQSLEHLVMTTCLQLLGMTVQEMHVILTRRQAVVIFGT
jgi:hypothetical protein